MNARMYLLLTSEQQMLAEGMLKAEGSDGRVQLEILNGKAATVEKHEIIYLMGSELGEPPMMCKLLWRHDDVVMLQKVRALSPSIRKNYRVKARFKSFAYPVSGKWQGRKIIETADISCGGLAFYSDGELALDEIVDVVICNIPFPVIVHAQILRRDLSGDKPNFYASKFVNLCPDEEQAVCTAVFELQMRKRRNQQSDI